MVTNLDSAIDTLIDKLDDFVNTNMGQVKPNLRAALQSFAQEIINESKNNKPKLKDLSGKSDA